MSVNIGEVQTFNKVHADKAQVMKIAEEAMEVFSAWEDWRPFPTVKGRDREHLLDECADVIQATCNLLASLGVDDAVDIMTRCKARNAARGRL